MVGQTEQIVGAQTRLHVLEGDVVDRLSFCIGMADVLEHLFGRRADVDFLARDAQRLHQVPGVGLCAFGRGEARHGEGQNVLSRQRQAVEGAAGHQQRLGRVQPAGDANDDPLAVRRLHAPHQALDLNVEGLVAVLIQPGRVVGHEGEAVQRADQVGGFGGLCREESDVVKLIRRQLATGAVRESTGAQPLQTDPLHIHVGDGQVAFH